MKEHLNGKVRRYVLSGRYGVDETSAPEPRRHVPRAYSKYTTETSENLARMRQMRVGTKNSRFGFTADEVSLAVDLTTLMTAAETSGLQSPELLRVIKLKEKLGDELFNVLYDFLHAGKGFEAIEKQRGFPARSAKVLLSVALKQVVHFGLDGDLAAMCETVDPETDTGPNAALAASPGTRGRPVRPVHAAE